MKAKKKKLKLEARIKEWEAMRDGVDEKNKKHPISGFYYRKPGSLQ